MYFSNIKKIECEPQAEPFELKEGMKFKVIGDNEVYTVFKKIYELVGETYWPNEFTNYTNEFIDWEATRKLNEIKEETKTRPFITLEMGTMNLNKEQIEALKRLHEIPPFELKKGMQFKIKSKQEPDIFSQKIDNKIWSEDDKWCLEEDIDREETFRLNNKIPDMRAEKAQGEPKQEKHIVWNPKGSNPKVIHESRLNAELEASRLAKENPNQEFYVLKVVSKAKGTVKVEWE